MINKKIYHELISQPVMTVSQMKDLEELLLEFPYSQNIRQLYLKALYNNQSLKFESELKKATAFISDRAQLKKFILSPTPTIKKEPIFTQVNKKEQTTTSAEEKIPQKNSTTNSTPTIAQELNDEFLSEAINASISQEVSNTDISKENELAPPQKEDRKVLNEKKSFLDWLKNYDEKTKSKEQEAEIFKEKAAALIDQFINSQPKITPKKDFYSPIDMANKSLQDDNEIVSETLATIYFQQGNYNKAINTYQQLSLKFPEKKAYFASQIDKVKTAQKK